MATNAQRSLESRRALIDAGRALFGEHGYADTSTPAIAAAAGVSRGALYHHFADKQALFQAVVQDAYESIEAEIENSAFDAGDPLEALIEGGEAFISTMSDPLLRRILLVDGPAVLGGEAMLSMDNDITTNSLQEGIEAAQELGRLPADIPADALTSMMSGAYDRAVLDGFGASEERQLAIRQAIRSLWFGLSKLT